MFNEKDIGPMLVNLLLIVIGVIFAVWLTTISKEEMSGLVNGLTGILTLLLIQPGIFITAKALSKEGIPLRVKIRNALLAILLGIILPIRIISWIQLNFSV